MRDACREAEVNHFDDGLGFVQEDVLELDVSVCNVPLVAVVYRSDDLSPQELGFEFWHLPIWLHLEIAVKTASVDVLHDEEHLLVGFESFIEFGNVLMVQFLHDFHFSLHTLSSVWLKQLELLIDFDCDLLV